MDVFDDIGEEFELKHIGIKRRSGRYPWGSGNDPYQRSQAFKSFVKDLKDQGFTPTQIAESVQAYGQKSDPHFAYSTTDLRDTIAISTEVIRRENIARAKYLSIDRKMSNIGIAKLMDTGEATIRGWLKATQEAIDGVIHSVANVIRNEMDNGKDFLDVGKGNQLYMNISDVRLRQGVALLRDEGYELYHFKQRQGTSENMTRLKVLCKPGTSWSEARKAVLVDGKLSILTSQSDDNGQTFRTPKKMPVSLDSKRISVRYAEDGGAKMDGVIELRRGVADLDLGASRYGQVRVAVDGTHYLKGMAMYADDLPAGVDVRYNSNKKSTDVSSDHDAMKPMETDKTGKINQDNPFGSSVVPMMYTDKNGKEQTSPLNLVGSKVGSLNIEGRWDEWSKNLSSQMLSKQPVALASAQLGKARTAQQAELDKIKALTNPVVKQRLLVEFADNADAAAVHLKAAHMPRQSTHVILPMNSMRPHEIYARNFDNGDKVVLVRHPHGGPFEIPELTVNNKNLTARRILSNAQDAVGIHHTVAEQLSGADFDGDTVLVIPNPTGKIKSRPPLDDLKNFDPKTMYKIEDDDTTTVRMTKRNTQMEMGKISNLITDMTIQGADDHELARAIKHSMVVIDAEKHGLDYKQSAADNRVADLKRTYQGAANKGASTIISRASAEKRVAQRKYLTGTRGIDPETGERVYIETGNTRPERKKNPETGEYEPTGKMVRVESKGTRMEYATDAKTLMSTNPQPMEVVYADHANAMKALANDARKESVSVPKLYQSPDAKGVYSAERESLEAKLQIAQRNAPLERRAQVLGAAHAKQIIDANPQYDKDDVKKVTYQSIEEARQITGAAKNRVHIADREWEAIQAGAITATHLREILSNADMDRVKALATPRYRSSLTPGQIARAKSMQGSGKGLAEIAEALGIPRSTIVDNLANA